MRITILPKRSIVAWVLPLMCFFFSLPNYIHVNAIIMQQFPYYGKREELQQEYSHPQYSPLLTSRTSPSHRGILGMAELPSMHTNKNNCDGQAMLSGWQTQDSQNASSMANSTGELDPEGAEKYAQGHARNHP